MSSLPGWLIFGVGVALLLLWVGLSTAFVLDRMARDIPGDNLWVGPIALGVLFGPFGLIFAVKGWRGRHLRIDQHEHGLVYVDGAKRREALWDDVQWLGWESHALVADLGLGLDVTTRRLSKLVIQVPGQAAITIDERFPSHQELAHALHQAASAAMLPRYQAALFAGQRVAFGDVAIDGWGMHLSTGGWPWDAIQQLRWESRGARAVYVVVGARGTCLGELDAQMPNSLVFEALLAQRGKLGDHANPDTPRVDAMLEAARSRLAG